MNSQKNDKNDNNGVIEVTDTINNLNNFVTKASRYEYIEIARKFFMVLAMIFLIAGCFYTLQILGLISQQIIELRQQIQDNNGDDPNPYHKTTLTQC